MKYVHNNMEWAASLQNRFEEYMDECFEAVDGDVEQFQTVSGELYCGCSTCFSREAIMWLMPEIVDAYRAGIIEEESDGQV
jgi:hypothetical protein